MDNRSAFIVEELYRLGPMSNQELSRHMNLSPASITHILQPMVFHGILKERPPEDYPDQALHLAAVTDQKIRRKITVTPNPEYGYVLALDFTGKQIQFRKIDFSLTLEPNFMMSIEMVQSTDLIDLIAQTVRLIRHEDTRQLLALGLTVVGRVDASGSQLTESTKLNFLVGKDLAGDISRSTQVPVILTNAANALSIHERFAGKARLLEDFFSLHINDGAGMGIFTHGQLYEGHGSQAGASGHWIVDPAGPEIEGCPRGSFESYVSHVAIAGKLREAGYKLQDHEAYRVLESEIAKRESGPAVSIMDMICGTTAWLCTNLMQIFAPQKVFISGPLAELGEPFLSRTQKRIHELAMPQQADDMARSIELSSDWKRSMAIGTAQQVIAAHLASISRRSH